MEDGQDDPLAVVFDAIVLGTGAAQCIFSAAAAKAGWKVLHLDGNDYYGELCASWPLHGLAELARGGARPASPSAQDTTPPALPPDAVPAPPNPGHGTLRFHGVAPPLPAALAAIGRRWSVDLFPQLTLARSSSIDTLIASGVSSYLEFVMLQGAYTLQPDGGGAGGGGGAAGGEVALAVAKVRRGGCGGWRVMQPPSLPLPRTCVMRSCRAPRATSSPRPRCRSRTSGS
jgi:hypothetical protein